MEPDSTKGDRSVLVQVKRVILKLRSHGQAVYLSVLDEDADDIVELLAKSGYNLEVIGLNSEEAL